MEKPAFLDKWRRRRDKTPVDAHERRWGRGQEDNILERLFVRNYFVSEIRSYRDASWRTAVASSIEACSSSSSSAMVVPVRHEVMLFEP